MSNHKLYDKRTIKCSECRYFKDEHKEMEGTFGTCSVARYLITNNMSDVTFRGPDTWCWIQEAYHWHQYDKGRQKDTEQQAYNRGFQDGILATKKKPTQ